MLKSESGSKKLMMETELKLAHKLRNLSRSDNETQISNSRVVTATCLTAMNWPKYILRQFDVICIDEAAFGADWLTLPLALSDIPRLILCGDHHQLPPVTVNMTKMTSIMEDLIGKVPTVTLNQQYR